MHHCWACGVRLGLGVWYSGRDEGPAESETAISEVKSQQTPAQVVTNYEKHIRPVFEAKCAQCHAGTESRPFFYHIPLVSVFSKPYIDDIIRAGRVEWDFTQGFPSERTGSSMEFLLKVHDTVHAGTMPIASFRYLRPWTTLSKGEEALLTTWAKPAFTSSNRNGQRRAGPHRGRPMPTRWPRPLPNNWHTRAP